MSDSDSTQQQLDELASRVSDLEQFAKPEELVQPIVYQTNKKNEVIVPKAEARNGIGLLLPLSPPTVAALEHARNIKVSPDNKHVYVLGERGTILVYARDETDGLLTLASEVAVPLGEESRGLCLSPDGANLYTASIKSPCINVFLRNAEDGSLTHVETITAGTEGELENCNQIVCSPDAASIYVSQREGRVVEIEPGVFRGTCGVYQFSRDTESGELTAVGFSQVTNEAGEGLCVTEDGLNVYVACRSGHEKNGSILVYSREAGETALTLLEKIEGTKTNDVATDLAGINVYATQETTGGEGGELLQFKRDIETGALTPLNPSHINHGYGSQRSPVIVSVDQHNVYSCDGGNGGLWQDARETGTGPVTPLPIGQVVTGGEPITMSQSPDGLNVYVANWQPGTISMFAVE